MVSGDCGPAFLFDPAQLFEQAPCGLVVTNEGGMILRANQTFCRWVGRTENELVGERRIQEMFTMGGRIFHQTHWAPLLRMQGSIAEVKLDILHSDGTQIPLLMNVVRRAQGDLVRHEIAVFIAKDRNKYEQELLAARKRAELSLKAELAVQQSLALAETRLRLALESGPLFVWDVDPVTRERRYDDGVALLLGYEKARPVTADDVISAMPADDRDAEAHALSVAIDHPDAALRCTIRFDGVDGVQRVISATGIAVFGPDQSLVQFIGVLQDISEQHRRQVDAEDRARFAEQMIGIVSHDLRNPLSTIKMAAGLLSRDSPTSKQERLLGHIDQATDRSKRLIADLLDFTLARVGHGINIARQQIDLHSVVARALGELALAFPGTAWEHKTDGVGECVADPDRLVQLLGNLVANAVSYGAPDSSIRIRTRITPASFTLAVQNQGEPIPTELLATMFEPMTRGENIDDGARSVGLGLFIVREIAHAHAGHVDVASTAEGGTVFTATFPRSPAMP
jgi:sigma-B regulation protein RsbU (phosphoserine phosphatase)